jgi:hypothetical protein
MKDTRDLPSFSVWGKPVVGRKTEKKAYAITVINSVNVKQTIKVDLTTLGLSGLLTETDVWSGVQSSVGSIWQAVVPPGEHRFVLLEEVAP